MIRQQNIHSHMQNIHSHTIYCDGKATPEEMVLGAIEKGCGSFGFSGHSYAAFDMKHSMSRDDTVKYMSEVKQLKERYADSIELYMGVEQEYYADPIAEGFDFIIGAVHYVQNGDTLICVDNGAQRQRTAVDTYFHGDYYSMAELYFETTADVVRKTGADIVAHFDLITKYNFNGSLFDETHPRYIDAALGAMDEILKTHKLFEVNTGAMYRFNKPEPYPSAFLLKQLCERGGEVLISSDSHNTESICYKYADMLELVKACGFKYIKRLTRNGFTESKLQ